MTEVFKKLYCCFYQYVCAKNGEAYAKRMDARIRFGRKLDLDHPVSLADKIIWLELNKQSSLKVDCTDKYLVRDYLKIKEMEQYLIPLCADPWFSEADISFDGLPNKFIMKATHGCKMNHICLDMADTKREELFSLAKTWLCSEYVGAYFEPHYRKIKRGVICENLIASPDEIVDYKIHCINGNPEFILTCCDRSTELKLGLYDLNWRKIDGLTSGTLTAEVDKPENLDEMICASKRLSEDFDFVRVDLYETKGRIYFGELTFTPASGVLPYFTDEFLKEQGKKLVISSLAS